MWMELEIGLGGCVGSSYGEAKRAGKTNCEILETKESRSQGAWETLQSYWNG